jgi:glycogen synthase
MDKAIERAGHGACSLSCLGAVRAGCVRDAWRPVTQVPIVTSVGGLKDLVSEQLGHRIAPFPQQPDPLPRREAVNALLRTLTEAVLSYPSAEYRMRQQRCMEVDVSWSGPAKLWEAALQNMMSKD